MRFTFLLILFCFIFSVFGSAQDTSQDLDSLEKVVFKEEALNIQKRFLESIRNIITSSNAEDLVNSKSYFLTLFFNSNAQIDDKIESNETQHYKAYRYREILSSLEMNSPIFNKEFKNDDTLTVTKGAYRIFENGENSNYYPFKIDLYFYEKLLQSSALDETKLNDPSFNAYENGMLKNMRFDIFVNGTEDREIKIQSIDIIGSKNGKAKEKLKSILNNETPWSSESEEEYLATLTNEEEDISIEALSPIVDTIPIYIAAYPSGGWWSGKGIERENGRFSPFTAYDKSKKGRQEVELTYSRNYGDEQVSQSTTVILSEELAGFITEEEKETISQFDPNFITLTDLADLGISERSLEKIDKYRKKCKRFKVVKDFYKMLNEADQINIADKSYSYNDLKNSLYKILVFIPANFNYKFDPNYLSEVQLLDMQIDPHTRKAYQNYIGNNKITSIKKLSKVGCFCNYEKQLERWVVFNPENRTIPKLAFSNYVVPGLGHMKFEYQGNRNSRYLRTVVYGGSFLGAGAYATYHKLQSNKWNSRHVDSERFRDAQFNLAKANTHHKQFIIGTAVAAGVFIANIAHLKILEISNRNAIKSDDVPRIGYWQLELNENGAGLVYNF